MPKKKCINKVRKVVFNSCFGGFSLSELAVEELLKLGLKTVSRVNKLARHDPRLVSIIEKLGDKANGRCAELAIAIIKGNKYIVAEYDGQESVVEPKDQKWTVIR